MKLTPKGMRDILPEDMLIRKQVIERIERIYRRYGFRPMETPALEYLDTLKAKAGEEADKQIFSLEGEKLALRFDLTVPLARVSATNTFPKPFKRYAIERVWRREEPQRGRFREFWQADVDIIGSASMRCEAELLGIAREVCNEFGFGKPQMLVNNRKILDALADKLKLGKKKADVFRALDKLDKMGEGEVRSEISDIIGNAGAQELFALIRTEGSNEQKLAAARKLSEEGAAELEQIVELCDFDVDVDLSLVRGLGYYTGPVFEIKLAKGMGTVVAGGRYDNLLGIYGQADCATGISVGIERLITLILERDGNDKKTYSRLFVATPKKELYPEAARIAYQLRIAGIEVETDLAERNLRKQFDYANSLGIPNIAIIGEREIAEGKITLRNMESGKEEGLGIKEAIKKLKGSE
jgi:histidyl-tRNA synthetase